MTPVHGALAQNTSQGDTMDDSYSIFARLRSIRDADLSDALASKGVSAWSAKGVLYTLTTYADADGVAYPTIATIARTMNASRRTVQRALSALVDAQILSDWQGKDDIPWTVWIIDYEHIASLAGAPSQRAPQRSTAQRARRENARGASWRTTNRTDKEPENPPHNTPPTTPPTTPDNDQGDEPAAAGVDPSPTEGEEALVTLGVDRRVARELAREHGDARCTGVARAVRAKQGAGHDVRNPAGFAVGCLRDGWEPTTDAATRASVDAEEGRAALDRLRALDPATVREKWERFATRTASGNPAALERFLAYDPLEEPSLARKLVAAMDAGEL